MMKPRVVLVLPLICAFFLQAATQTQDESILARQNDESARSLDERQHALTILLAAARQARDFDPIRAARFLNRAARLQVRLNSSRDALANYEDALALLNGSPDFTNSIDALNGIATIYSQKSQCSEAQKFIDRAISLSDQHQSPGGRAEALLALSDCQNRTDRNRAVQTAQEALQLWQSIGDRRGVARAYTMLSDFQIVQNNLIDATKSNEAALAIWRELDVPDEQAGSFINLGFIEYRKGAWQSCMSFLTQAQALLDEKSESFRMGQINAGISEAFIESGMPEAGLIKAKEALEYYRLAEDPRGIAASWWDIGKAYYFLGNNADAIAALEQAKKDAEAIKDPWTTASCHDFLGRTYAAMGDQESAREHLETALSLFTGLGNSREAARVQALMGRVCQEQGKVELALASFRSALTTFERIADRVNESAALYALGRLELNLNNLDIAEDYLRRSIDATENIRRSSSSGDLMAAFSATVHERYQSYIECQMRKHQAHPDQGLAVRAFETSEQSRARSLTELLRATQTTLVPGDDPQLAKQEKSLLQMLRVKEDAKVALLSKPYKKEDLTALESELSALEREYGQLNETIKARFPAYARIAKPTGLSLKQIQEQLFSDDQTTLLEFSLGPQKSYVWVVTRTEFSSYELPAEGEIEATVRKLYSSLTRREPANAQATESGPKLSSQISELSKTLLGPFADKLKSNRLLIVADGPLQHIPFQTLTVPIDKTQPGTGLEERALILDHEIVYQPSASALLLFQGESANRQPTGNTVAILADPVFEVDDARVKTKVGGVASPDSPGKHEVSKVLRDVGLDGQTIPRLFASRSEADAIMKAVPWFTGYKALDFEASRATAMGSDLSKYRIVHFATHAFLDDQSPELTGIVLSMVDEKGQRQNGYLRLSDIYGLKLPVDLVVLSACQTGLGKDVKGEGLIGLTRGFMYAGASGVVASLWKVDDEATAELMKHFYEALFDKGLTPAAALRDAQLALRQQKRWQEPYYWAGFVIQGQYDQQVMMGSRSREWQFAGLVAFGGVLLAAIWFVLRRKRSRVRLPQPH
jgi:CHAT domain-containing protein/tetratricopeptide (TPR) repeat protein